MKRIVDGATGTAPIDQTFYHYDQGQVALEFHQTGSGDLDAGDLSHRYLWGPAVDMLLADEQVDWSDSDADGETLWALGDHLNSVRDVVDSQGDLRLHRVFDAFGNVVQEDHYNNSGVEVYVGQAGFVDLAFAFTGRYLDQATGLQNNLNRWYDGSTGRWMSEDPIGFAAGDANLARYVGNVVTTTTDPSGLLKDVGWDWPSWGSYWDYLTNPSKQDPDIQTGQKVALATSAVCLTGAGIAVATGTGGIVIAGGGAGASSGGGSIAAQQILLRYGSREAAMAALAQTQAIKDALPRGSDACIRLTSRLDQMEAAIIEAFPL